jgi:hypothetical protein
MKQVAILVLTIALFTNTINAQSTKTLTKVLELAMPDGGGANGASVCWHPVSKKYYAAIAGNTSYPLGLFDSKGKILSPADQTTMFDIRGLWYNTKTKTLQMNGYNDLGWVEYKLSSKGLPASTKQLRDGMAQPAEQSVAAYNSKANLIYFLNDDGEIEVYDMDGAYQENFELTLGKTEDEADEADNLEAIEDYNNTTVIYTGIGGAEIGLLNFITDEIELYDLKKKHLTRKLSLPEDAPVEDRLNFSYANGIYWLFDKDARAWVGYK